MGALVFTTGLGGFKRRRMVNGEEADSVCVDTFAFVRESGYLEELKNHAGDANGPTLKEAVDFVSEACNTAAHHGQPAMNQCTFYVTMAEMIDINLLKSVWLDAYGNVQDQNQACGSIVNAVNTILASEGGHNFPVRRTQLESNQQDVYVSIDNGDQTPMRRMIDFGTKVAAATGATIMGGVGTYLAHVCKNFNTESNMLVPGGVDLSFD